MQSRIYRSWKITSGPVPLHGVPQAVSDESDESDTSIQETDGVTFGDLPRHILLILLYDFVYMYNVHDMT